MNSFDCKSSTYAPNEYFTKKIDKNRFLVTTKHGDWLILKKEEYLELIYDEFSGNKPLFKKLEEKGIILTKKNIKSVINKYRAQYCSLAAPYINCIISFTKRCNLGCVYCHADSESIDASGSDMDEKTMDALLSFIYRLPHQNIVLEFQGGEPLLALSSIKKFIKKFKKHAKKHNKYLHKLIIVTNLTLMTPEIASYLLKNKFHIGSSLDGPKELHDAQRPRRGGGGTYEDVICQYNYFKKKNIIVGTSPTITRLSLKYGAKRIIDEYVRLGRHSVLLRPVRETGRGKRTGAISPGDFFKFWKDALDYCVHLHSSKKAFIYERNTGALLKNIFYPLRTYMCMRRPCGATISQLSFDADGAVFVCDASRSIPEFKIGDVKTSDYTDIVLNTLPLRTLVSEAIPLCDTCAYTAFCGSCVISTYPQHNDIIPRTPKDFECKIYKKMLDYIFEKINDPEYNAFFKQVIKVKE